MNTDEKRRRLEAHSTDLLETWKLSPIDDSPLDHWDVCTEAAGAMFAATDPPVTAWAGVNFNDKRSARINATRHLPHALLSDGKDSGAAVPAILAPPTR